MTKGVLEEEPGSEEKEETPRSGLASSQSPRQRKKRAPRSL